MNNDVRKFVRTLCREKGWSKEYMGTGHVRLTHPSGESITVSASPSDWRWQHNARADVRRVERKLAAAQPAREVADAGA